MTLYPPELPPSIEIPGQKKLIAHAALMCVVFVLLLPLAALTTRSPIKARVTRVHAPGQIFNVVVAIIGMSLGISVARTRKIPLGSTPHFVLGFVVIACLVILQPVLGVLQHHHFRNQASRGVFGWGHLLLGRALWILGLINGVRGFKLAHDSKAAPYYAVLAVICVLYVAVLLWDWLGPKYFSRKRHGAGDAGEERDGSMGAEGTEMHAPEQRGTK